MHKFSNTFQFAVSEVEFVVCVITSKYMYPMRITTHHMICTVADNCHSNQTFLIRPFLIFRFLI